VHIHTIDINEFTWTETKTNVSKSKEETKFSCQLSCIFIGDVKRNVSHDVAHDVAPYLLTLANRNDHISVATPKVANASTIVAVT
jgi:hypothetical protein